MIDVMRLEEDLKSLYPDAGPELHFQSDYELLVAVILSAQCTDVRVNIITGQLFPQANTPEKMLSLGEENIREIIRSCGMYRQKAKALYHGAQMLLQEFDGVIPGTREELMRLPGVGRKNRQCRPFKRFWRSGDCCRYACQSTGLSTGAFSSKRSAEDRKRSSETPAEKFMELDASSADPSRSKSLHGSLPEVLILPFKQLLPKKGAPSCS